MAKLKTDPTPTTAPEPAPTPDPAAAWLDQMTALLDDIQGGTLRKLEALAASPPEGAGVFPALSALLTRFEAVHFLAPDAQVRNTAAGRVPTGDRVGGVLGDVARRLLLAADKALDAGLNDPADPIVRPKDFGPTAATWSVEPFAGPQQVGDPRALPADHAFRTIEPFRDPETGKPMIILGRAGGQHYRLSVARDMTSKAITHRGEQEAERKRLEEQERERAERAWKNSPAGMMARIKALEAELAAVKRGDLVGV